MKLLEIIRTKLDGADGGAESLESGHRAASERYLIVVGWLAMIIYTFHACTHMVAAGDTWVAMACGRHFVNHGVDTVEPFSANSHHAGPTLDEIKTWPTWAKLMVDVDAADIGLDMEQAKEEVSWLKRALLPKLDLETIAYWHPTGWVNQNWLTHVIFYRLATMFGSKDEPCFNALVVWKFAVYFLTILCLYGAARVYGVTPLLAAGLSCCAMFIGRSFLDVRPAGFSNLLVAAFILVLALTSYRNTLYIWLIVPLVVFWSNVHGGYLYAFIALTLYVGWHAMLRLPRRWVITVYSALTWLVLWGMARQAQKGLYELAERYLGPTYFRPVALADDRMVYILFLGVLATVSLAVAGGVVMPLYRKTVDRVLVAVCGVVSAILFTSLLLGRFYPVVPENLSKAMKNVFVDHIASSRLDYVGLFLFAAVLVVLLTSLRDRAVRTLKVRTIGHTIGAGVTTFAAMVIFNPFHLTNLTHTFVISVSKHAQRWRDVHEWHRAFSWDNPVGTAIPFLVMCTVGWLALVTWAAVSVRSAKPDVKADNDDHPWPKIDLALLVIAAMTIYMAVRSRRFIPIAAYAACPVLALVLQETVTSILTWTSLRRYAAVPLALARAVGDVILLGLGGVLVVLVLWRLVFWRWLFLPVPGEPTLVKPHFVLTTLGVVLAFAAFVLMAVFYFAAKKAGDRSDKTPRCRAFVEPARWAAFVGLACFVVGSGAWVGLRFKRVYLDYWPADPEYTSIFMRMTASDAKPFKACQFMRENKLSGNMFNYWTEGGFVAWGQDPDPNTGKTPLQLFMDGRAQAAYDCRTFDLWTTIMAGGEIGQTIARRAQLDGYKATPSEYSEIGDWVSEQLTRFGVWVVLMPANQFDKPMVLGLEHDQNWQIAFMNNRQKMFVDIRTEQGRKLYEGIFDGTTKYPDAFSANLTQGYNLLLSRNPDYRQEGLEKVIKAFELDPSPQPMLQLLLVAAPHPQLHRRIDEVCTKYMAGFLENKASAYAGTDGYNLRLEAARLASFRLQQIAQSQGEEQLAEQYVILREQYLAERNKISMEKRW